MIQTTRPTNLVNRLPQVSKVVVEPYNAVFSTSRLISNSDETFFMDNEALRDICINTLKLTAASYQDMNLLISAAMAGKFSYYFTQDLDLNWSL